MSIFGLIDNIYKLWHAFEVEIQMENAGLSDSEHISWIHLMS